MMSELGAKTDLQLNVHLATLLGELEAVPSGGTAETVGDVFHYRDASGNYCECHPDYINDWSLLMELSLKYGVFLTPLDKNRSHHAYRAKHIKFDEDDELHFYSKLSADSNEPQRAMIMSLIKVLEAEGVKS